MPPVFPQPKLEKLQYSPAWHCSVERHTHHIVSSALDFLCVVLISYNYTKIQTLSLKKGLITYAALMKVSSSGEAVSYLYFLGSVRILFVSSFQFGNFEININSEINVHLAVRYLDSFFRILSELIITSKIIYHTIFSFLSLCYDFG